MCQNFPVFEKKFRPTNQNVKINGSEYLFNFELSVFELIKYLGFNENVIVIDCNGSILEKKLWGQKNLQENDSLEILSVAGGG